MLISKGCRDNLSFGGQDARQELPSEQPSTNCLYSWKALARACSGRSARNSDPSENRRECALLVYVWKDDSVSKSSFDAIRNYLKREKTEVTLQA